MQVNLVDWLKMMVGSKRSEEVVDPNIERKPSVSELKRALLTALRCVDPDSDKRPKMSQVARMLNSEENPIPRQVAFILKTLILYQHSLTSTHSHFITTYRIGDPERAMLLRPKWSLGNRREDPEDTNKIQTMRLSSVKE